MYQKNIHAPIFKPEDDKLGRNAIVGVIFRKLVSDDCPSALGILGSWGTGKSSLLNLIYQYNSNENAGAEKQLYLEIIDAWQYEITGNLFIPVVKRLQELAQKYGAIDNSIDTQTYLRRVLIVTGLVAFNRVAKVGIGDLQRYKEIAEEHTAEIALQDFNNQVLGAINSFKSALGIDVVSRAQLIDEVNRTIDLFIFYINLIRGSVLNNSRNTIYGPPIIRLNHGTMYNNVPCLLQDYTINIIDDAGYDVETVTPKRVSISLNLVESRTGNFGNYVVGDIFNGDNLTGWESVIENNTIDPYNGLIGATAPDPRYKSGVKFK